jgi:hypothetical protein
MNTNIDLAGYAFDDEVSTSFFIDFDKKIIEIEFPGCFDLSKNEYQEKPCTLTIKSWNSLKSKLTSAVNYSYFEKQFGIITLILASEFIDDNLHLIVSTIDQRNIELVFEKPAVSVNIQPI